MTKEQKFSITMRPIQTGVADIKIVVKAIDPVQALQKAREAANQKFPEIKSTVINYWEIELID
jgi:hypothetical protein